MPKLIIEKGPDKGKVVSFAPSETAVIGREPAGGAKCTLHDALASRLHCRLEPRSDGFWLVDGESMNGTFLNGHRTKTHKLVFGDKIEIGESMLSFLSDSDEKVAWPIGQVIRGYDIKERVGRGGMGTVYKAVQKSLARVVAFKLLSQDISGDRKFLALFFQEARAAGQLNHPNIVQTYDTGSENGAHFISMEFMPGGSLQDILAKSGKLPVKVAVSMMLDAARGLEYAERKQLIHRDIKPDNLMIGEGGVVKIGDLGLAKSTQAASQPEEGHAVFGTPHFIAPEQALNKPIDHRADLYALGSTFYRILTGTTPYAGSSVREIILRKLKEDPPAIEKLDPLLPPNVCALVTRLMARDPAGRPRGAAEVVAALDEIKRDFEGKPTGPIATPAPGASTIPISAPAGTTEAAPPAAGKPLALAGAAVAALFLLAAGIGGYWWTHRPKENIVPPTPIVRPFDPPRTTQGDSKSAKLEALLLQGAQELDRRTTDRTPAAVRAVIAAYQQLIDECPDSKSAATARDCIIELEGELRSVALANGLAEHRRAWEAALKVFGQKSTVAEAHAHADLMLKSARERIGALRAAYAEDSKAIGEIDEEAEKIEQWAGDETKAAAEFDELDLRLAGVPQSCPYGEARTAGEAYLKSIAGRGYPFEAFTRSLLKRVGELETAAYREAERKVKEFLEKGDPENADDALVKLLTSFSSRADAVSFARDAGDEIRQLRADRQSAQHEKDLIADREILVAARADAILDDFAYAFGSASRHLSKSLSSLKTVEARNEARALSEEYDREQALFKTLIERINSKAPNGKAGGLNNRAFRGGTLVGATEVQLNAQVQGGEIGMPWGSLKPKDYVDIILKGWELTGEEAVALALYCQHRGLVEEAEKQIAEAKKKGADVAWLEAIQGDDPLEDQARVLWNRVQGAPAADAKRLAQSLLKLFADTDLVKRNRQEIQKYL
ncbi:MAG: protein kinase [Planctomycetes bacterium]|nr:protein kinase [Planctomycetota bacterium]